MRAAETAFAIVAGFVLSSACAVANGAAMSVFINEFHYDNNGGDVGEFIELAGPAGTSLAGWSVVFYNGADGELYDTLSFTSSHIFPDQQNGMGTLSFARVMQNGPEDGLALVNGGSVVQFLSYEGSVTAVDGTAAGMTSVDIGVLEAMNAPVGSSLQLLGTGRTYNDFTWTFTTDDTPGFVNLGQTFTLAVPEPASYALVLAGLVLLGFATRRGQDRLRAESEQGLTPIFT